LIHGLRLCQVLRRLPLVQLVQCYQGLLLPHLFPSLLFFLVFQGLRPCLSVQTVLVLLCVHQLRHGRRFLGVLALRALLFGQMVRVCQVLLVRRGLRLVPLLLVLLSLRLYQLPRSLLTAP
jgi:hypothetical protein